MENILFLFDFNLFILSYLEYPSSIYLKWERSEKE